MKQQKMKNRTKKFLKNNKAISTYLPTFTNAHTVPRAAFHTKLASLHRAQWSTLVETAALRWTT